MAIPIITPTSDSNMRRAAPDPERDPIKMVDSTKRYVELNGQRIQGNGINMAPQGTNLSPVGGSMPQHQNSGHVTAVMPNAQQLPAFPNTPVKPPTLIFSGADQMQQPQLPFFPVKPPMMANSAGPAGQLPQTPQWPQMPQLPTPQLPQFSQTQLPQLSQPPQLQLQPLDWPGQLQRLAAAASEGNLLKVIQDARDFFTNNINNATAAANSILTATNDILVSLPKNITIPGELGKLINTSLASINATTSNMLKALPKPAGDITLPKFPSLGMTSAANARLGAQPASLPGLGGMPSLQLPKLPGGE